MTEAEYFRSQRILSQGEVEKIETARSADHGAIVSDPHHAEYSPASH